jgi:hypothetical protein
MQRAVFGIFEKYFSREGAKKKIEKLTTGERMAIFYFFSSQPSFLIASR